MAEPVLEFAGVEVWRGRRCVLREVDLRVSGGDALFLAGPNGAGKSTLLAAALGAVRPRAGTVRRAPDLADRAALGYVPQRCTLDPTLPTTTAEFVDLGLVGLPLGRGERHRRVAAALAEVGLGTSGRRSPVQHSEGERQRLLLARALAREPRVLLMDEPTASLDPGAAERFWELALRLRGERGLTLVCATHDLAVLPRLATAVAVCTPGPDGARVAVVAPSAALPALRAAFASPAGVGP